jgi:hypothetical protein
MGGFAFGPAQVASQERVLLHGLDLVLSGSNGSYATLSTSGSVGDEATGPSNLDVTSRDQQQLTPLSSGPAAPHAAAATLPAEEFVNIFKKPLEQPILVSPPRPRKSKATRVRDRCDEELIPKRSARLAAKTKSRAAQPEAQARKVMMRRIGLDLETVRPDEATFQEFQEAFKLPLSASKREALNVLFQGRKQRGSCPVRAC